MGELKMRAEDSFGARRKKSYKGQSGPILGPYLDLLGRVGVKSLSELKLEIMFC